jgi:hypothetical protein
MFSDPIPVKCTAVLLSYLNLCFLSSFLQNFYPKFCIIIIIIIYYNWVLSLGGSSHYTGNQIRMHKQKIQKHSKYKYTLLLYTMRATCSTHLTLLYLISRINTGDEEYRSWGSSWPNFLQFWLLLLRPKYLPWRPLVSNILKSCSAPPPLPSREIKFQTRIKQQENSNVCTYKPFSDVAL